MVGYPGKFFTTPSLSNSPQTKIPRPIRPRDSHKDYSNYLTLLTSWFTMKTIPLLIIIHKKKQTKCTNSLVSIIKVMWINIAIKVTTNEPTYINILEFDITLED